MSRNKSEYSLRSKTIAATEESKSKSHRRLPKRPDSPLCKREFNEKCKPSAICLQRSEFVLEGKSRGNEIERSVLSGRFFYHFAVYDEQWTLFVLDSVFKQTFIPYNAFDLRNCFEELDFNYVPYDFDTGIVHNKEYLIKIQLDHKCKKVRLLSDRHEIPREPDFPFKFWIHTVEILKNGIVFIYTCRVQHIISQRLYLYDWETFPKRLNFCKIGIRDAAGRLLFVSGQSIDGRKLCVVHMQDKSREFGKISPLVLYWDSEGAVSPDKFEKIESNDGQPFQRTLKCKQLDDKNFTGAWHGHLFSMFVTRYIKKSKRWNSAIFVFDAIVKKWTPIIAPNTTKLIRQPLIGLCNAGNDDDTQLVFYAKDGTVPTKMFWMPVRTPQKLQMLSESRAAQLGLFDMRERIAKIQIKLDQEEESREEHRRLANEHNRKSREHAVKAKELKKQIVELSKKKVLMVPNSIFTPMIPDDPIEEIE